MPRYNPRTGALDTYQVGPFDSAHIYVQWGGKLPGGEEWSCGFRMLDPANQADVSQAAVDALVPVGAALSAYHARAGTQIGQGAKFSFVKTNAIGLDGRYIEDGTNEATYPDQSGAGAAGFDPPNQIAWAVSLTTGFSRGPAHRGRFFLPLPTVAISEGAVSEASADNLRISTETLRTAVNAAVPGWVMVVMSRKAGAPGHRAVTGAVVGRVLDTQRRRRRSLAENYQ